MAFKEGQTKSHRDRKNPRSQDLYNEARKTANAARPKQHWVGGESIIEGGYWVREAA